MQSNCHRTLARDVFGQHSYLLLLIVDSEIIKFVEKGLDFVEWKILWRNLSHCWSASGAGLMWRQLQRDFDIHTEEWIEALKCFMSAIGTRTKIHKRQTEFLCCCSVFCSMQIVIGIKWAYILYYSKGFLMPFLIMWWNYKFAKRYWQHIKVFRTQRKITRS